MDIAAPSKGSAWTVPVLIPGAALREPGAALTVQAGVRHTLGRRAETIVRGLLEGGEWQAVRLSAVCMEPVGPTLVDPERYWRYWREVEWR